MNTSGLCSPPPWPPPSPAPPAPASVSPHPSAQHRVGASRTPADKDVCGGLGSLLMHGICLATTRPTLKLLQSPPPTPQGGQPAHRVGKKGTFPALPGLPLSGSSVLTRAQPGVPPATSQPCVPHAGRGGKGVQPEGTSCLQGAVESGGGEEREDPENWRPVLRADRPAPPPTFRSHCRPE